MTDQKRDLDPIFLEAIENLPDGVSIYGADGRPILFNKVTQRRFPHMFEAFASGAAHSYLEAQVYSIRKTLPDLPEEEIRKIATDLSTRAMAGETYEVRSADNRKVQITFRPMSEGRSVAISVDVTELRQREKDLKARGRELEEREKELQKAKLAAEAASNSKSAFLANMSHEIRTPLNGIMGMAQVMEATALNEQQREYMSTILESGKTLMTLLNDVLDLSKIEAGKFDIVPTDVSVQHMLRRQLKLWKPRAEEKGLELSLAFDAELPAYLAFDAVRVQQCVSNLVSNAIKFTKEGRVEIFASAKPQADGSHLVDVRVRDTGPGMDAETLDRLFKPFAQADETISRKHGGTGLGLSITRRLAELMGGRAVATSEPGRGSTFHISFRAAPAKSQPANAAAQQAASSGDVRESLKQSNLRVLLVDDHPINRQVASLFLRPFNMRIVEAVNGQEALAALTRETFDLVLLDMHMPVMDGPTTIGHIRASGEAWRDIPVVALTADAMSGDRERYLAMGMDGYLSKPLAERDLLAEIARVRGGVSSRHTPVTSAA
jgi:signal transduction histidine kinase/CheY-like chemotaxis protein